MTGHKCSVCPAFGMGHRELAIHLATSHNVTRRLPEVLYCPTCGPARPVYQPGLFAPAV